MGNRAVITTPERKIDLYLHWNGGRDTIDPLLRYCELKSYRAPSQNDYGWARLCQMMGNFFGDTSSIGIGVYTDDERMNSGDNGIYIIDGWKIVDRILPYEGFIEQHCYDPDDMIVALDRSMPQTERLGEFLDSTELPTSKLKIGEERLLEALPRCRLRWKRPLDRPIRPRRRLDLEPQQPNRIVHCKDRL